MAAIRKSEDNSYIRLHHEDDLQSLRSSLSGHGPQQEAVVEIDRDDDLASLRSKLESGRAPRAVVFIPSRSKILKEGLEFRVLRRLQRELGLDIIIVTPDPSRRSMARENGFTRIFGSMRSYYSSKIPVNPSDRPVPFTDPDQFTPATSIGRLGILVGAFLLALAALVAYVALPEATVTVYAEPRTLTRDVEVVVELGGPPMDITSQRLAGQLIEQRFTVEDSIKLADVPAGANPELSGFNPGSQVTVEARDALRNKMLETANARAKQVLKAAAPGNNSLPDASVRTEIVGEKYDKNIGDSTDSLGGSLEIAATGIAFSNEAFNRLVTTLWSQEIPQNYRVAKDLDLTPPAVVRSEPRFMTLRVKVSGQLQPNLNTDALVGAVRGNNLEDATRALSKLSDLGRPARVSIWPEWANRAYRIQVVTAGGPGPTADPQVNR